jgi:hypothetical protein
VREVAALAGALTHGLGLAYVVSDSGDPSVAIGVTATVLYLGGLVVAGVWCGGRLALIIVVGESVATIIVGMVVGGFDNEAWGLSIVLLTLVAILTLSAVAATGALRTRLHSRGGARRPTG